jgi:uncharacterized membrane protein YhaH (DUF805 family)
MKSSDLPRLSYWRSSAIAAGGAIVMIGGGAMLARSTENLTLVYGFIAVAAGLTAAVGVYVKRRTDRRLQGRRTRGGSGASRAPAG